jgi:hypothetical protein
MVAVILVSHMLTFTSNDSSRYLSTKTKATRRYVFYAHPVEIDQACRRQISPEELEGLAGQGMRTSPSLIGSTRAGMPSSRK